MNTNLLTAYIESGPTHPTTLCPNPYCPSPFTFSSLGDEALQLHYAPGSICHVWLEIESGYRQVNDSNPLPCPNPACTQTFPSFDSWVEHWYIAGTPCNLWLYGSTSQYYGWEQGSEDVEMEEELEGDDTDTEGEQSDSAEYSEDSIASHTNQGEDWEPNDSYSHHPQPYQPPPLPPDLANIPNFASQMRQTGLDPQTTRIRFHPGNPKSKPGGRNHIQEMEATFKPEVRRDNHYYPFADATDWEVAAWLAGGSLSMAETDRFLKSKYVSSRPLSFANADQLRHRIAQLPAVPSWKYQEISIPGYETRTPMILYFRDALEVVCHQFKNPLFADHIEMTPYQAYDIPSDPSEREQRLYGSFMSGDFAWEQQDRIPPGECIVGIVGTSDKTPLTIGTGDKEMHPVLVGLGNLKPEIRMKASSQALAPVGYLPIPKFKNVTKEVQSILAARVYHRSLDIIFSNAKIADRIGIPTSDPWGGICVIHTPLAAWIADNPEQLLIAGLGSKQSPFSTANAQQLGDHPSHPIRTANSILTSIALACKEADPWQFPAFVKVAKKYHLNRVVRPFWFGWGKAEPAFFLTPDPLHQWHKFAFDHVIQWVINIIGGPELDRRLRVLQPMVGIRPWRDGVSTLKQLTGRDHRALERIIVAACAGAVDAQVLCAIRAIIEFIFQAQRMYHYEDTLHSLEEALREFHDYKNAIINAGGRKGKNGPLLHFEIPKLESMLHVARLIRSRGAAYQWTSDITERCHITLVKTPYRLTNKVNYHPQCCRFLDRQEKIRFFNLYTALVTSSPTTRLSAALAYDIQTSNEDDISQRLDYRSLWTTLEGELKVTSGARVQKPLLTRAHANTSSDLTTSYLLTKKPHFMSVDIDEAALEFQLPNLRLVLANAFGEGNPDAAPRPLPFTHINIWKNIRIQSQSTQDPRMLTPIQTIQALPPSSDMPFGRYNTVLLDGNDIVPFHALQIRLIFQPVLKAGEQSYYFYGRHFKIVPNHEGQPDPQQHIEMYKLRREYQRRRRGRTNNERIPVDSIQQVSDIRQRVQLVPVFGKVAQTDLNENNSMELMDEFYLNSFESKETFHAVLAYL